jgi:hypothetical protein
MIGKLADEVWPPADHRSPSSAFVGPALVARGSNQLFGDAVSLSVMGSG